MGKKFADLLNKLLPSYNLEAGEATAGMLQFISEEKLRMIVSLGKTLKGIRPIIEDRYKFLPKTSALPIKEFMEIKQTLLSLQRKGWLAKEGDTEDIMGYICGKCEGTSKATRVLRAYATDAEILRLKITRPPDVPLLIVAYALAAHMRRANWKLICNIMTEQKLINTDENIQITEVELRERLRKTTEARLKELYSSWISIYSAPSTQQGTEEMWAFIIGKTFPAWSDLVPKK